MRRTGLQCRQRRETTRATRRRWEDWLRFRRQLVASWLQDTVDAVRQQLDTPIGVSFDLNFSQREQFATPPYGWSKLVDFVSVYCYGREPDAAYVPRLMRTVSQEFRDAGVPMIGFLEFSSGLAGQTPGDEYAKACAPFVAGLMTSGPVPGREHDQSRVDAFIQWARKADLRDVRRQSPMPANVLLVIDRTRIDFGQKLQKELARRGKTVDVRYVESDWDIGAADNYRYVLIGDGLELPLNVPSSTDRQFVRAGDALNVLDQLNTKPPIPATVNP